MLHKIQPDSKSGGDPRADPHGTVRAARVGHAVFPCKSWLVGPSTDHLELRMVIPTGRGARMLMLGALLMVGSCSDSKVMGPIASPAPNYFSAYAEPAWHPGGRTIAFNHTPLVRRYRDSATGRYIYVFAESLRGIWAVDTDGSNQNRLLPYHLWTPDWDSTGSLLAYEQGGSIWTIAGSDSELIEVTATQITTTQSSFAPTWRRDGNALAFSVNGGSASGVYMVPRAGGATHLVGGPGWIDPDWSPSGDSLVFIAAVGSSAGICVTDTLGQGLHMLWGSPEAAVGFPRWSPDGGSIAFTGRSRNTDPYQLWVMDSDGSAARTIISDRVLSYFSWSPDGREIAYVKFDQSDTSLVNGTLWIVDVATGSKRQLTFNTPSN